MTFEEFEKAGSKQLRAWAKGCFDRAKDNNTGEGTRIPLLLEAQFYMAERDRRHDNFIAWRDLILEVIVIFLIGWEIVVGGKQERVLQNLQSSSSATASTLSALQQTTERMNAAIQRQTALMTEVSVEITFDTAQKRINIANKGNGGLELWGDRLDNGKQSIDKEPRIISRGGFYYLLADTFYKEVLEKFPDGFERFVPFEVYLRNDDGTEYVAICQMLVKNTNGALQIHTQTTSVSPHRWSRP
jgi:hypothetical protein